MNIIDLLKSFPKSRPQLGEEMSKIYEAEHKKNRSGATAASSMAQKLEGWMHRNAAKSYNSKSSQAVSTLEIGAGMLNQIPFEVAHPNYDIIEPMKSLYEESKFLLRVRNCFKDISDIPLTNKYNRIISIAVLEHLVDLPSIVRQSIQLLENDGVFACGIPSEGGFLWGAAWRLTTGLDYRIRTGYDYGKLMKHEHLNEAWEIELILQHFFKEVKVKRFGIGRHFSLYTYIECRNPIAFE